MNVQASAAPQVTAGTAPPPAVSPARRRGRLGPVRTVHVVALELAVLAVLAALGAAPRDPVALTVAAGAAVVLLAVVFTPTQGGWWYERAPIRRRWRRRRYAARRHTVRRAAATRARDPRLAPLARLEPSLTIRTFQHHGAPVGIGQDRDGWFAALAIGTTDDLHGERGGVPLGRLARACADTSVPATSVSVVSHLVPAPVADGSSAVQSYRDLLAEDVVAADLRRWVVVRLGPVDAAVAATSRGGGLDGVERAVATLASRLGKALAAAALPTQVLDPGALAAALVDSCRVNPFADLGDSGEERWDAWHADGLAHTCLQLTGWPDQPPEDLFTALAAVPAALVAVAVTFSPGDDDVDVRCVVRLTAEPAALAATIAQATAVVRRAGARVRRLNGLHAAAVYATAPTAAGVR